MFIIWCIALTNLGAFSGVSNKFKIQLLQYVSIYLRSLRVEAVISLSLLKIEQFGLSIKKIDISSLS